MSYCYILYIIFQDFQTPALLYQGPAVRIAKDSLAPATVVMCCSTSTKLVFFGVVTEGPKGEGKGESKGAKCLYCWCIVSEKLVGSRVVSPVGDLILPQSVIWISWNMSSRHMQERILKTIPKEDQKASWMQTCSSISHIPLLVRICDPDLKGASTETPEASVRSNF